jgi:peptidyl-prolyl cis-trans isomerase SurA
MRRMRRSRTTTLALLLAACGRGPAEAPAPPAVVVDGVALPRALLAGRRVASDPRAFVDRVVEDWLVEREAAKAGVGVDEEAADGQGVDGAAAERRRERRVERLARALLARRADPDEVQALFGQRFGPGGVRSRVRLILVSTDLDRTRFYSREAFAAERDRIETEARVKARDLRARIVEGADFAEVAREASDDASAPRGGDLGPSWRGRFGKAFDEAVAELSTGELSPVVESEVGFHVIQVEGIRRGARYTGRHLLVLVGRGSEATREARFAEALAKARRLRAAIEGGQPFAAVAGAESDDSATRAVGGDLGTFNPGRLDPTLDPVLETLPVGRVSEPIRVPEGYELVLLTGREFVPADDQKLVRHLLVATDYEHVKRQRLAGRLEALASERAEELLAKLRGGADFAALAAESSDDELTRAAGGEYPGFRPGALGPEVDAALAAMGPGDLKIVRTARGFQVLQLVDVQKTALAEVRAHLEAELRARPPSAGDVERFRASLRQAARVEVDP